MQGEKVERKIRRRIELWRKEARRFRAAQNELQPHEEEWQLNKEQADVRERLASEIEQDLIETPVFT